MENGWVNMLDGSIRDVDTLGQFVHLEEKEKKQMKDIVKSYPICINQYYLGLINKDDPEDPIRKMCIPDIREFSTGEQTDISCENENTIIQGLQHKYKQTVQILSTNQCAMYCRHCFKKKMVGSSETRIIRQLPVMADYVRHHKEINNVCISGGDSFMTSNAIIEKYLQYFTGISSLDFISFGTRIPVVLPQRIIEDDEFLRILESYGERKQIIIVTQFNHPRELTPEAVKAIKMLKDVGCIIRNQTVLLKGVNSDTKIIAQLMNELVSYGVIPYYIFQCRPVAGVKNQFQVPLLKGIEIVESAKVKMNGQAKSVRYVLPHQSGKIEILGKIEQNKMLFKYHQAKHDKDQSRIFTENIEKSQCWLSHERTI